jgi:hypothetical protein
MEAAQIYFSLMTLAMILLATVHIWCRSLVKGFPQIMPDEIQRDRFRWMELAMAVTCVLTIWYMWMVLDYMVTFCATSPREGFIAHMPWIVGAFAVLGAKTGHLMRLRGQAQG